ncbi:hypothetical protein A0257_22170 [Hymenobacter psoromatis]|nr:hypothetical protein A0257_22170 [Hymenobacter psoromatis]
MRLTHYCHGLLVARGQQAVADFALSVRHPQCFAHCQVGGVQRKVYFIIDQLCAKRWTIEQYF